jgi:hypothetical protein
VGIVNEKSPFFGRDVDKKVPFPQVRYLKPPSQRYPKPGETAQWIWQKRYSIVSTFPSLKRNSC